MNEIGCGSIRVRTAGLGWWLHLVGSVSRVHGKVELQTA